MASAYITYLGRLVEENGRPDDTILAEQNAAFHPVKVTTLSIFKNLVMSMKVRPPSSKKT